MSKENDQTYDSICFTDLVYEFNATQQKKIESKIKKRLKYHKLGAYDQARVDYIRSFKNEISAEIGLQNKSAYYKKSLSEFSELTDFNVDQMKNDYQKKYDQIDKGDIDFMIGFAIYYYHLR